MQVIDKIKRLGIIVSFILFSGAIHSQTSKLINFLDGEWFLTKATYHYIGNEPFTYNLNDNGNSNKRYKEIDYKNLVDPIYLKFDKSGKSNVTISNIKNQFQQVLFEIDKDNVIYLHNELYYQILIQTENQIELNYQDEKLSLNLEYQRKK